MLNSIPLTKNPLTLPVATITAAGHRLTAHLQAKAWPEKQAGARSQRTCKLPGVIGGHKNLLR